MLFSLAPSDLEVKCNVKKFPERFLADIDKFILNFIWKCTRSTIAKIILKKKNKVGGMTLLDMEAYYTATVIQMVRYWPGTYPQINRGPRYGHLSLASCCLAKVERQLKGCRRAFSTNGAGAVCPGWNSTSNSHFIYNINSKWIVDFKVTCKSGRLSGKIKWRCLRSRARQRVLRLDNKRVTCKRKDG